MSIGPYACQGDSISLNHLSLQGVMFIQEIAKEKIIWTEIIIIKHVKNM